MVRVRVATCRVTVTAPAVTAMLPGKSAPKVTRFRPTLTAPGVTVPCPMAADKATLFNATALLVVTVPCPMAGDSATLFRAVF